MTRADASEPTTGIIPIEPLEFTRSDHLMIDIADLLNDAVTGPAIGVHELARRIIDLAFDKHGVIFGGDDPTKAG